MAYKLSQLVRHPVTREVATIAALADAGRIHFRKIERFGAARRAAYFADLIDDPGTGWEIGKLAYLSRTGLPIAV